MKQTMFDFEDGNGPVPAHKHPNGGGWVADTATVADTAYVGANAEAYVEWRQNNGELKEVFVIDSAAFL